LVYLYTTQESNKIASPLISNDLIIADLLVSSDEQQLLKKEANHYPSWKLTDRQNW